MPKSPNEIELSKEIKLLIIGVILGALASGIVTYTITWKLSHDEYITEQQNIANALYIDVSNVEDKFNRSMNDLLLYYNNSSELDDPNSFMYTTAQYYSNNGLYYVFCKDIAGFDSDTSNDLYAFYNIVVDIENDKEVAGSIVEKYLRGENITQYDVMMVHQYTRGVYLVEMPYCIMLAEKIKQELRQTYNAKATSLPTVVINNTPRSFNLQGGKIRVSTAF